MDMDYFKNVDIQLSRKTERYEVNFTKLERGMYISQISDDIAIYDLRTRTPNFGGGMDYSSTHSLCHIFDDYAKKSQYSRKVIYFGVSSSRTGFNLIVRGMSHSDVISLARGAFEYIRDFTGEIPSCDAENCANFKEHNLDGARKEATLYLPILNRWSVDMLVYPK